MKKSVFLFFRNEEGKFLSCFRSDTNDFGLVGGCVDEGETLEEALKREVLEEANLEVEADKLRLVYEEIEEKDNYSVSVFTYDGIIDFSTMEGSEEGEPTFCTEEELVSSTYGAFNKKLIEATK